MVEVLELVEQLDEMVAEDAAEMGAEAGVAEGEGVAVAFLGGVRCEGCGELVGWYCGVGVGQLSEADRRVGGSGSGGWSLGANDIRENIMSPVKTQRRVQKRFWSMCGDML